MIEFLERFLENVEDTKARIEEATLEGSMGDVEDLVVIIDDLIDELDRRLIDEEE